MTNKPMLSVELRVLLERVATEANYMLGFTSASNYDECRAAVDELRALLDSPPQAEGLIPTELVELLRADLRQQVESAKLSLSAQNLGEPVALQHMAVSEGGVLRWMTGRKMQDCELYAMPDGSAIRAKLFVQQPAPVADSTTSDKYKAELYDEVWQLARSMGFNNVTDALTGRVTTGESESECTSCDGSGEYTDAIGDWRGYCTCSAGVEAESLKGDKP